MCRESAQLLVDLWDQLVEGRAIAALPGAQQHRHGPRFPHAASLLQPRRSLMPGGAPTSPTTAALPASRPPRAAWRLQLGQGTVFAATAISFSAFAIAAS